MVTGATRAARRARSGWRRSPAATTTARQRITRTSDALRKLPALDEAHEQRRAHTRPGHRRERGRDARDRRRTRTHRDRQVTARDRRRGTHILPPLVADDQALYARRALRMTWTGGRRELKFSGSLPLEQGVAFEQAIWNIAKPHRAADKKSRHTRARVEPVLRRCARHARHPAQRRATMACRRSPTTQIVHLSEDGTPPLLEGAGPISPETAERLCCDARRLVIKPCGSDLVHSRVTRCASYPQMRALYKRAGGHCQYPGCTATRELQGHHMHPRRRSAARPSSTT